MLFWRSGMTYKLYLRSLQFIEKPLMRGGSPAFLENRRCSAWNLSGLGIGHCFSRDVEGFSAAYKGPV